VLKEGQIGVFEASAITTIMIASNVFFTSGWSIADRLGPAAWYGILLSACTALGGFYILFLLLQRFQGQGLVPVYEAAFGRPAGGLLLLLTASLFLFNGAMITREFVEAGKVYFYPLTPPSLMIVFFLLAVVTLLHCGLEVIVRSAALFAWPLLTALLAIFFFAGPLYSASHLFPILGPGPVKTLTTGLMRSSMFGEVIVLAVFVNALQGAGHFKKAGVTALVFSGALITLSAIFYTLAFPYPVAAENTIPLLALTRVIEYGRFFQRFDSIFLFAWSIVAMLAVAVNLYAALSIYCRVFRIDDHRALLPSLAVLVFSLAILLPDISSIAFIYVNLMRQHGWLIGFGLPLLALLAAVVRGKKGGPAGA